MRLTVRTIMPLVGGGAIVTKQQRLRQSGLRQPDQIKRHFAASTQLLTAFQASWQVSTGMIHWKHGTGRDADDRRGMGAITFG